VRRITGVLRARAIELRALPRAAKLGGAVIAFGLVLDAWVHTLGVVTAGSTLALIVQQHIAHLVVLVGMVAALAGIVADGVQQGRHVRPERRSSHAIR
jgi:uncharacterized membrane protein YidH (DUF202 family)